MNLVNEQYDAMILRYLEGQCSQDEALALLSWVAESEENRLYFKSFTDVWSLTDFDLKEDEIDVEAALESVNLKIDELEETVEPKVVKMPWLRRNFKYVSGVAAVLVLALFLGFLLTKPFNSTMTLAYDAANPEMIYQLPDNSTVAFDGEGSVMYPKHFAKDGRAVQFEGKALFDIAKDEERPFVIHCEGLDVEVLGTSFMLDARQGQYIVDLYSGKVRMTTIDKNGNAIEHIDILPNERGVWSVDSDELKMMTYAEVKQEELTNDHVLDFNNVSLSTIVETLEFIYEIKVNLPEAYASEKVTMRFSEEDSVEEVLETIATVFGLHVTYTDDVYSIR